MLSRLKRFIVMSSKLIIVVIGYKKVSNIYYFLLKRGKINIINIFKIKTKLN